jgi:metal-responsive CopG/Arc/MetJ family transcriptional regulator
MEVVSIKVDKRVRDKMKKLSNVNWSETIRQALAKKIQEEEAKTRTIDMASLLEASSITDRMRKASKGWSSTEEIRNWRQTRR